MGVKLQPVLEYGLGETADLLSQGFSDYVVPVQLDLAGLLHMMTADGLDMAASRIIVQSGRPVGVALIARRGWTSRLAGMAIIPDGRGQGVGSAAMGLLLDEARARGERRMVLEVIDGNEAAIALYEKSGFRTIRRLLSFAGEGVTGQAAAGLEAIDIREAARRVALYQWPDLPWQLSAESVALLGPPAEAWQLGQATAVISDPAQPVVGLRSLIVHPDARRQGEGSALMGGLAAAYPGKGWRVPALCPEEAGPFFTALGFVPGTLSQRQMVCAL